jgi:hypothetical protein
MFRRNSLNIVDVLNYFLNRYLVLYVNTTARITYFTKDIGPVNTSNWLRCLLLLYTGNLKASKALLLTVLSGV